MELGAPAGRRCCGGPIATRKGVYRRYFLSQFGSASGPQRTQRQTGRESLRSRGSLFSGELGRHVPFDCAGAPERARRGLQRRTATILRAFGAPFGTLQNPVKFQCKIDVVHNASGYACQETKTDQDQQHFLKEHVLLLDNASDVATTMVLAAGVACLALLPVVKLAQGPLLIPVGRITAPHIDHA